MIAKKNLIMRKKFFKKFLLLPYFFILLAGLVIFTCGNPVSAASNSVSDAPVEIGTNDWAEELLGDKVELFIFNPSYLTGEAGFWSLAAMIFSALFVLSFLVTIFAIGFGSIKMSSSQGDQAKMASGKKWFVNGAIGFLSTIVFILITNLILSVTGIGSIFTLAQNVQVCADQALYQYKKEHPDLMDLENCTCSAGGWQCQ